MDAMAYVADATDGRGNAAVAPSCQLGRDCGARTCLPVSECWMEIGWCHAMKGARGVGRAVPCVLVGASWQYREQPDPHAPLRCIAGLALLIFVHAAFVCTAARALVRLYTQYRVPPTPGLLLGLLVACVDRSCRQRHPAPSLSVQEYRLDSAAYTVVSPHVLLLDMGRSTHSGGLGKKTVT